MISISNYCIVFVAGLGCIMFVYWRMQVKRATPIYMYVTILLFSIFIEKLIEYLHIHFLWQFKSILLLFIISIFIGHMAIRLTKSSISLKKMKKEISEYTPKDDGEFIIAIVEDDIQVQGALCGYILKSCPNTVPVSMTMADEVFDYLKKNKKLGMIVCDMRINGDMSGIDLCRKIKKTKPWIVFIGMTGYPYDYTFIDARKTGFDDYFVKPFRMSDLSRSIVYHKRLLERWNKIIDRY